MEQPYGEKFIENQRREYALDYIQANIFFDKNYWQYLRSELLYIAFKKALLMKYKAFK